MMTDDEIKATEPLRAFSSEGWTVKAWGPVEDREGLLEVTAPDGKVTDGIWSVSCSFYDSMGDTSVVSLEDDNVLPPAVHDACCTDLVDVVHADTYCMR